MINILYVLNGPFEKGGTETVVLNYYNSLNPDTFHVDFMIHGYDDGKNKIHRDLINRGSRFFYVTPRGESYKKNIADIGRVFSENKFDIVHCHMDAANMFVLKEAKKYDIPVRIAHSHNAGGIISKKSILKKYVYELVLAYAKNKLKDYSTFNIACSEKAGKWLFGKNDYLVINNGIDFESYRYDEEKRKIIRDDLGVREDTFLLGHIGRFAPQKNHSLLIDIFKKYHDENKKSKLMLIGQGELEQEIRDKVKLLEIEDSVLFLGVRDDISDLMCAMDVFLLPSLYEGLPLVGVEAQASGLKCLVSEEISKEVVISDNIKLLPIENSLDLWVNSILSISGKNDGNERKNVKLSEKFNLSFIIKQLEDVYKKLYMQQ